MILTPIEELARALGSGHIQTDVQLAPYTTFKIGGPADLFVEARSAVELATIISLARDFGVSFFLLGLGANILVGDRGFRGIVILNRANDVSIDHDTARITAESGAIVWPDLVNLAVDAGLSGLEHYAGIPSTVGGALWQNLHFLSPDRSRTVFIEEVLAGAELLTENGDRRNVDTAYFEFGYDVSILHHRPDVVLKATFQLQPADPSAMRAVVESNLAWRGERHPPLDSEPSAGSIFKKIEGIGAGRLIDQCGLKGYRVGGAEITRRHANIIINRENATAADVVELIRHVQEVVEKETGHHLEPEIGLVGAF